MSNTKIALCLLEVLLKLVAVVVSAIQDAKFELLRSSEEVVFELLRWSEVVELLNHLYRMQSLGIGYGYIGYKCY